MNDCVPPTGTHLANVANHVDLYNHCLQLNGQDWAWNVVLAATLVPGPCRPLRQFTAAIPFAPMFRGVSSLLTRTTSTTRPARHDLDGAEHHCVDPRKYRCAAFRHRHGMHSSRHHDEGSGSTYFRVSRTRTSLPLPHTLTWHTTYAREHMPIQHSGWSTLFPLLANRCWPPSTSSSPAPSLSSAPLLARTPGCFLDGRAFRYMDGGLVVLPQPLSSPPQQPHLSHHVVQAMRQCTMCFFACLRHKPIIWTPFFDLWTNPNPQRRDGNPLPDEPRQARDPAHPMVVTHPCHCCCCCCWLWLTSV